MLERHIYRLDGSLRRSETFDEADLHLRKIRDEITPDRRIELQVFSGVELLLNNPNELRGFIRDFDANISSLEILNELNGNTKQKGILHSLITRDLAISSQLSLMNKGFDNVALIEKANRLIMSIQNKNPEAEIQSVKQKVESKLSNH